MVSKLSSNERRLKRHRRIRSHITGTTERPRLNVFRSSNNIYAQIIDDTTGKTLAAANSLDKALKDVNGGNKEGARKVGLLLAEHALQKGIKSVVYDRGGYLYHGRVRELAEGAREGGLEF